MTGSILHGEALARLKTLPDASVDVVFTSPPYWGLRSYVPEGHPDKDAEIGLEESWRDHMARLLPIFKECVRVLKPTGNLVVNYGDTVVQSIKGAPGEKFRFSQAFPKKTPGRGRVVNGPRKHKIGLAWRLRFLLNDELGLISRDDVVWWKRSTMPLSMKDRLSPKYEMLFRFVKEPRYYFDLDAIRRPLSEETLRELKDGYEGLSLKDYANGKAQDASSVKGRILAGKREAYNMRARAAYMDDEAKIAPQNRRPNEARSKTQAASGTPRAPHLRLAPEPGEEGAFHPLGSNPGDLWDIPAAPTDWSYCNACDTLHEGARYYALKTFIECLTCGAKSRDRDEAAIHARDAGHEGIRKRLVCSSCGRYDAWVDHFAVFPPELVRRVILATCPREICVKCGTPRKLVTERVESGWDGAEYGASAAEATGFRDPGGTRKSTLGSPGGRGVAKQVPVGHEECSCGAGFRPGVVLDPFAGSFTTCIVAAQMGLDWIGIELRDDYVKVGRARLAPYMHTLASFGGSP